MSLIVNKLRPAETCNLTNHKGYLHHAQNENNYFHEHLSTIYFITKIKKPDYVIEIGAGPTTLAFHQALQELGHGQLHSVDISKSAWDAIEWEIENDIVTKYVMDSTVTKFDFDADIIFIDGDHSEHQVRQEIEIYLPKLKKDGFIIFHDTNNPRWKNDVNNAILDSDLNTIQYERTDWLHCNGLTVFRKIED